MKKLYFRELGMSVEMQDHVADGIETERTRVRRKEQQNGRCFVTRQKMYLCDGLCDDCEFHRQGGRKVDTKQCEKCDLPSDKRGRAPKCRNCKACTFVYETTTLDEPIGEEGDATRADYIPSEEKGPEDIVVEKIDAEEYCREAGSITRDGAEIVARVICGETISEAARSMEKPQGTIDSRKTALRKNLKIHQ